MAQQFDRAVGTVGAALLCASPCVLVEAVAAVLEEEGEDVG